MTTKLSLRKEEEEEGRGEKISWDSKGRRRRKRDGIELRRVCKERKKGK